MVVLSVRPIMPAMISRPIHVSNTVMEVGTVVVAIVAVFAPMIDILLVADLQLDERICHRRPGSRGQ
ncbi:hypothetical protein [Telmatospirillum sp.]|uniref:hypothetical protein n=1 Tax=Telmatospirillum sp. TaxID=2079197 RepID=UPI0028403B77|nr:hypothetical protein [Telmatospirillum sp.]MDR3436193.1 hypothetical protein [Telmatospirillum sp.]